MNLVASRKCCIIKMSFYSSLNLYIDKITILNFICHSFKIEPVKFTIYARFELKVTLRVYFSDKNVTKNNVSVTY